MSHNFSFSNVSSWSRYAVFDKNITEVMTCYHCIPVGWPMILTCPLAGGVNSDCLLLSLLFWCSNCPTFDLKGPLHADFCVLLRYLYHSFSISLLPSAEICFSLILYLPCPALDSDMFLRGPTSFLCRVELRNQDLGASCAHCRRGVAVPRPELRNTHKDTHLLTSVFIDSKMVDAYW